MILSMNSKLTKLHTELNEAHTAISSERKEELITLAASITASIEKFGFAKIISVCTHNSRRSQLMQIMLQFFADITGNDKVFTFSGGTEGTAFNHRMVAALRHFGFDLLVDTPDDNPVYKLFYEQEEAKKDFYFSKKYDNAYNPSEDFIAVMVCTEADTDCPIVPGAFQRLSLPYIDPKVADDTPEEEESYRSKVLEIGREMAFVIRSLK